MGAPSDYLVPAAVLYDNPGLTLEEFGERLTAVATKVQGFGLALSLPFDAYGMARILNLKHTPEYIASEREQIDEFGFMRRRFYNDHEGHYTVAHIDARLVSDREIVVSTGKLNRPNRAIEVGELFWDEYYTELPFIWDGTDDHFAVLVTEVLETERELEDYRTYEYLQKLKGRVVRIGRHDEYFPDVNALADEYPEDAPENVYDFTPDTGILYPTKKDFQFHTDHPLRWIRRGDRYRLDPSSLVTELSPNSYYTTIAKERGPNAETGKWQHPGVIRGFSLTDLVLTCEAVRREYWEVLGYNGMFDKVFDFMYSDEQTLRRFETAQRDSELSMLAREFGWTHTEMMRERLWMEANTRARQLTFAQRVAIYKTEQEEIAQRAAEYAAELEKERQEKGWDWSDDDLPF